MARYEIKEDPNFPWVSEVTIYSDYYIDITSDYFNITIKDQLEYFISEHIDNGNFFELEELFKKDTLPTITISKNTGTMINMKCYRCGGTGKMACPKCGGTGYINISTPCTYCPEHKGIVTCVDCRR